MQYSFDVNFTPISSEEIPGIMNKVLSNRSDNDGYISTAIEGILLPEYGEQLKNNVIDDYCSDSWNGGYISCLGGIIENLKSTKDEVTLRAYGKSYESLLNKEVIDPEFDDSWNEGYVSCLENVLRDIRYHGLI